MDSNDLFLIYDVRGGLIFKKDYIMDLNNLSDLTVDPFTFDPSRDKIYSYDSWAKEFYGEFALTWDEVEELIN